MNYRIHPILRFSAAVLGVSAALSAEAITVGTYTLNNHPDGSATPPPYGLRLDGLFTGNTNEVYTFDFDHASSAMTLTYTGTHITIQGQAFGGQDNGSGYVAGTTAVWDIYFDYTVGISQPGGDGGVSDLMVHANGANFGSLSSSLGLFDLSDKSDGTGLSFQFGDENGGGHRNFNGISGWGWLMHGTDCQTGSDCSNIAYSDWLFTASPVPVPASVWLFGSSLLGLAGLRRRRA